MDPVVSDTNPELAKDRKIVASQPVSDDIIFTDEHTFVLHGREYSIHPRFTGVVPPTIKVDESAKSQTVQTGSETVAAAVQDVPAEDGEAASKPEVVEEEEEEAKVVISDERLPYDIVLMEKVYGEGHRGFVARKPLEAGDFIHMEQASVYVVAPNYDDEHKNSFYANDAYDRIPTDAPDIPDVDFVVLSCLLIEKRPVLARVLIHLTQGMHGRIRLEGRGHSFIDKAFAYFQKRCPTLATSADDETPVLAPMVDDGKWTKPMFTRLLAVVSLNAVRPTVPMTHVPFGTAFFSSTAYMNHSCAPNAVAIYLPNKVAVHALSDIKPGEEITIAYDECPRDYLSEDLVKMFHYQWGVLSVDRGKCKCVLCDELQKKASLAGLSPAEDSEEEELKVDLEEFLSERTRLLFANDSTFKNAFLSLLRAPLEKEGMIAAYVLFDQFSRFLKEPVLATDEQEQQQQQEEEEKETDVCKDLAFILGDIYCTTTIHLPGQDPRVPVFWASVYLEALTRSNINMPQKLETAIAARVFSSLVTTASIPLENKEARGKAIAEALGAWIILKDFHFGLYGHSGYTMRLIKALPCFEGLVTECASAIHAREDMIRLERSSQAAFVRQKEEELVAKKVAAANEALASGAADLADE